MIEVTVNTTTFPCVILYFRQNLCDLLLSFRTSTATLPRMSLIYHGCLQCIHAYLSRCGDVLPGTTLRSRSRFHIAPFTPPGKAGTIGLGPWHFCRGCHSSCLAHTCAASLPSYHSPAARHESRVSEGTTGTGCRAPQLYLRLLDLLRVLRRRLRGMP